MSSTIGGKPVLTAELRLLRVGAWHLDCVVDSSEKLTGKVDIDLDGSKWVGTIIDSNVYAGRCTSWIVGGAGGMQTEIDASQHVGSQLGGIVQDIVTKGGETVSEKTLPAVLSRSIPQWERLAGPVAVALSRLLDWSHLSWRILQDGTIWIGEETWPEVTPSVTVTKEEWETGVVTVAPVDDFNDLVGIVPGTVFRGHRIEQVVHSIGEGTTRTAIHTASASTELRRYLEPIRRELDYATGWLCEVKGQNADGTLQVSPVDKRLQGRGLDKVKIELGVPGTVKVPAGTSVRVVFLDRDPSRPVAVAFGGANLTELSLGSGADFVALAAKVNSAFSSLKTYLDAHTHPTGVGPSGPPAGPYTLPASVAAAKVKAE
jgi:hypothetical protein